MGLLKRLLGDAGRKSPPGRHAASTPEEPDWIKPDDHDGSPFLIGTTEQGWDGEEGPMLTRRLELRTPSGQVLRSNNCSISRWSQLGLFHCTVAGESHRNPKDLAAVELGEPAVLVPEPTNEFDPEAIRVESVGGAHVGYVPADATRRIRKVMKDQPVHAAFWAQHLTRRGQVVALEVMVWRPGRIDGLHEVPLHQEWSTPS